MRRLALLCLVGCGRLGFGDGSDAGRGDGRPADTAAADAAIAALAPIARWKLDDGTGVVALDSVGSTNGTLSAGSSIVPTWVATTAPRPAGFAVQFTGDGDDISFGTPSSLTNLANLTVGGWIDPTSVTDVGGPKCLFDKGSSNTAGWAVLVAYAGNGTLAFLTFDPMGSSFVVSAPDAISANRWTHVAATWDGTHQGMHLYIDGAEALPSGAGNTNAPRADDSTIGAAINCISGTSLAGQIDDVTIFDRVLAPAEILQLYGS